MRIERQKPADSEIRQRTEGRRDRQKVDETENRQRDEES